MTPEAPVAAGVALPPRSCVAPVARLARFVVLSLLFAGGWIGSAVAAQTGAPGTSGRPDSVATPPPGLADTTRATIPGATTGAALDLGIPVAPPVEDGLDKPVQFTARDSLRLVFAPRADSSRGSPTAERVTLYGDVRTAYDAATLQAAIVAFRFETETLEARALERDGSPVGRPQFAQGSDGFTGAEIAFNLRSQRGRVAGGRTQIGEGFLLGGVVKQAAPDVIYASDAAYTTCDNEDHPHYALQAGRVKVVGGETVYTGPVRMRLLGLPLPVWLPFGFFPATEGRRSGPLAVGYGRNTDYGLFLEDLGYYWALSDYVDLLVSTKVGTGGSISGRAQTRYARRYAYRGSLGVTLGRLRRGESDDLDFAVRTPFSLQWSHNQTFPAGQTLTGSVNLRSESSRVVSDDLETQVSQSTTSSITYAQSWPRGGRSLNVQTRANQNLVTDRVELTLPQVSFSQQRKFPFRRSTRDGRGERWYEKISASYSGNASNAYVYAPLADSLVADGRPSWVAGLFSGDAYTRATGDDERFAYRASHSVPIQAAYFAPRFNLTVTPSVRYTENWLDQRELRALDADTRQIVTTTDRGFVADRRVAATLSASTKLYGTLPLRLGPADGFRHVLEPRIGLTAQPDYSGPLFNTVRTVADSTGREIRYATVTGVPTDPIAGLTFNLDNAFLTRLVRQDSTGETTRRPLQLLTLNVSGGYNFAAQERPLGDLRFSAAAGSGRFNANASGGFSAYGLDAVGVPTTTSYLAQTGRPLRLIGLNVRAGWRLRGGRGGGAFARRDAAGDRTRDGFPVGPGTALPGGAPRPVDTDPDGDLRYDPDAPDYRAYSLAPTRSDGSAWSVSLDATAAYRPAVGSREAQWTATVGATSATFQLSPKWALNGSLGVDLIDRKISTAAIALRRDLHCWEMQIRWNPVGVVRGFGFSLYVKSGYLRDLLRLDLPNADFRSAFRNVGRP